jgi:acetyl-CoA C-acetyltransferase
LNRRSNDWSAISVPDPRTPVLVGQGQCTQRTARDGRLAHSLDPMSLMAKAARLALDDGENSGGLGRSLDTLAVVQLTADSPGEHGRLPRQMFRNPPLSVARKLGSNPRRCLYTATGGNTPQWLVNRTADEIARGVSEAALLVGGECLATQMRAIREGFELGWGRGDDGDPGSDPQQIGDTRPGASAYEQKYLLQFPVNAYPLFENAIRVARERSLDAHAMAMGRMFSRFTRVAADNPHAWFQMVRSSEELVTPSSQNRYVGFPYTKYLNAVIEVDMAAAVVMTSVARARELGIPESKWIYLHGCADANDIWNLSDRANYRSSPAIHLAGRKAMAMADIEIGDVAFVDLYSCFPSAVEIAIAELGVAEDDPRGLTVTGGLPYFGGPGSNYTMHAIATMMERLRVNCGQFGLCTGNGWYLTKHSVGIYSTVPVSGGWEREQPASYQGEIERQSHPIVTENPDGAARVETYTVVTDRKGRRFGIVIGRLEDGRRFLASTSDDEDTLDRMMREEMIGRSGTISSGPGGNLFAFG